MAMSCDEPQERREQVIITISPQSLIPADASWQASPDVSCWSSVEDYTKRHDSSFADVYSDDINTLLVFVSRVSVSKGIVDHLYN